MISTSNFSNTGIAFRYRSTNELATSKLLFSSMASPAITKAGVALTKTCIQLKLPVRRIIRNTIFRQFCGGETLPEAILTANKVKFYGVSAILDFGVEQKSSEADFDNTEAALIQAVLQAANHQSISFVAIKVSGLARFNLLQKLHLEQPLSPNEQAEWLRVSNRLLRVCQTAWEQNVRLLIDAEETWVQGPVNELTEAMMERFNRSRVVVYNTFQLYCRGTLQFLMSAVSTAVQKGYRLGAKLVRGAYMEKEQLHAEASGYANPIQPNKEATDHDFDAAITFCLTHLEALSLFIGTHNEESCIHAAKLMEQFQLPANHPDIFFSQLFGMSDHISFNMASAGYNVAKYLPYGPVEDVIPYLMRRAEENTSVAGQSGRELELIRAELQRRKHKV